VESRKTGLGTPGLRRQPTPPEVTDRPVNRNSRLLPLETVIARSNMFIGVVAFCAA